MIVFNLENHKIIALRDQWMDWAGFTLAAPCAIITLNLILLPPDKREPKKVLKANDASVQLSLSQGSTKI